MTPSELIVERNRAFEKGDFGFIFDSFHSDSNFRRQFAERDEYLQIGKSSLIHDFQIVNCRILDEKDEDGEAQVIFLMEMQAQGQLQKYAELAWLVVENGAWRYHRGLKVTQDELPDSPDKLTFEYFARLDQSAVF